MHGDTKFTGVGPIRLLYFVLLISHILLSLSVVPLALTSFYFAFTRAFVRHRRLNRVFLPILAVCLRDRRRDLLHAALVGFARDAVDATSRQVGEQARPAQQARERGVDARIQANWQLGHRRIGIGGEAAGKGGSLVQGADPETSRASARALRQAALRA